MVYESRVGDVFALGATSWRIEEITHDRVLVSPAFGQPGKLPFWKGDGLGRPVELGRALGAFRREVAARGRRRPTAAAGAGPRTTGRGQPARLPGEQREATGRAQRPHAGGRAVPRRARRLAGGAALALRRCRCTRRGRWRSAPGCASGSAWTVGDGEPTTASCCAMPDDGATSRPARAVLFDPDELERSSPRGRRLRPVRLPLPRVRGPGAAAAAAATRAGAARCGSSVRGRPSCWMWPASTRASRSSSKRSASASRTSTTCPRCARIARTSSRASPGGGDDDPAALAVRPVPAVRLRGAFIYEGDTPLAERRAAALSLDPGLLRELLGRTELRELLDPEVIERDRARAPAPDSRPPRSRAWKGRRPAAPARPAHRRGDRPTRFRGRRRRRGGTAGPGHRAPPRSAMPQSSCAATAACWSTSPAARSAPRSRTPAGCATRSGCRCRWACRSRSWNRSRTRSGTWWPLRAHPRPVHRAGAAARLGLGPAVVLTVLRRLAGEGRVPGRRVPPGRGRRHRRSNT